MYSQRQLYNNIRSHVPPCQHTRDDDTVPDQRLLDICTRVITDGITAMAALIADTYLTEVTQVLANQARGWIQPHVKVKLESLSYEHLISKHALASHLENFPSSQPIEVCNSMSYAVPIYTQHYQYL